MARYVQDQNKVTLQIESGLYASPSGPGLWIGQVTDNSMTDEQNLIESRFLGTSSRSYDIMDQGPANANGTITYNPQDMNFMFWAIGSVSDTSGTQSVHRSSEISTDVRQNAFTSGTLNPPKSWTIEDSKQAVGTGQNFNRTIRGLVPNVTTITAAQGEKVVITSDYVGQSIEYSSGTTTSITEETSPSYLWSDTSVEIGGSVVTTIKEASLEVNQNIDPPHYLNGSRVIATPIIGDRNYVFNVTLDLNAPEAKKLYEVYYKGGSEFNSIFDLNADDRGQTGSQHAIFTMSGCNITTMEIPSVTDGVTESTIEIRPKNLSAIDYTNGTSKALYAEL